MAARPTHRLAVVLLQQQRAALHREFAAAADAFRSPLPGSARAADAAWIAAQPHGRRAALEDVLGVAAENVIELLRVGDEHAAGLQVLLDARAILPNPSMALTRSIQDALLTVCWCADPTLPSEQRLTRCVVLTLGSLQDNHRAVTRVPNPPANVIDNTVAGMVGMQAYLQEHGFTLEFNKTTPPYAHTVSYSATRTSMNINMAQASTRYMPTTDYM